MKPKKFFETVLTVQGSEPFPIDMLRYSSCFPKTEHDARKIEQTLRWGDGLGERVAIELRRRSVNSSLPEHERSRWNSFHWPVESERGDW